MANFIEKTLAGVWDNDNGGHSPEERLELREHIGHMYELTVALEERGLSQKILTEQDWQVIHELNGRLEALVRPGLRISSQQSNSRGKRGETQGNSRGSATQ